MTDNEKAYWFVDALRKPTDEVLDMSKAENFVQADVGWVILDDYSLQPRWSCTKYLYPQAVGHGRNAVEALAALYDDIHSKYAKQE
jgi:hypothetical protein